MNKFAVGSLGAVTAHRIKWILSGRSTVEQMRQWQQALQAEQTQVMDAGPNRVSPLSVFQDAIISTRVTQMHDIVKTSQDGPESVKEILWSESQWLGKEREKAWGNYYDGYLPVATCGNDQCRSKDLCVLTSAALPSNSPSPPLHASFTPSTPGSQVPGVDSPCSLLHQVYTRCEVVSPKVEAMQAWQDTGQSASRNC